MSVPHTNGGTAETLPAASDVIRTTSVAIKRPTGHSHTTSVSSSTSLLSPSASIFSAGASSSIASSSTADTTLYGSGTDESLNVSGDYVLAMHDYDAEKQNATCLSFRAGQVIRVYNRDVSGWWDGELEGRRGWFPSNYVGEDITAVADEVSPSKVGKQRRHYRVSSSGSAISSVSWAKSSRSSNSSRDPYEDQTDEEYYEDDSGTYCPPAMAPLLHTLSLLQGAVRANRFAHFQPATGCIISCVRTILSTAECLPRDAPLLKQFPTLAKARKGLLSDLAGLVSQARKASAETEDEDQRDAEIEGMLKLAGRVFTNVRRFLVLVEEYGVEVPPTATSATSHVSIAIERAQSHDPRALHRITDGGDSGRAPARPPEDARGGLRPPRAAEPLMRVRSASELRSAQDVTMVSAAAKAVQPPRSRSNLGHRVQASVASVASISSSVSSTDSTTSTADTPPTPPFPAGPSSTAEILDVLRHTHNQYLSTIAAFVGQSHSHTRSSHASSTAHMYDLARDIVEMVCKLLTVVEAVGRHPALSAHKLASLRAAKDGLYTVTRAFAESVRMLTADASALSEEDERVALQRAATDALKAGAECVNAIKMALTRGARQQPLVVHLPESGAVPALFVNVDVEKTPTAETSTADETQPSASHTLHPAPGVDEDQDVTIQAQAPAGASIQSRLLTITLSPVSPTPITPHGRTSFLSPIEETGKALPPIVPEELPLPESRPPSMLPVPHTDDGSSGEGSRMGSLPLEEKLIHGDLPPLPTDNLGLGLGIRSDTRMWMVTPDYADDEVAYHPKDGHLVAATLPALVEKLTPHDALVDSYYANVFFLTFRLFSSPAELLDAIIRRHNLVPPAGLGAEDIYEWQQRKGIPVRLRVTGVLKNWLDAHWLATDAPVLPALAAFVRDALGGLFPGPAERILTLAAARHEARGPPSPRPPAVPWSAVDMPRPLMTKGVLSALRARTYGALSPSDFDPLELARQFTLMEAHRFAAIGADEVLRMGHDGGPSPPSIRAVTGLSTAVTGWVSESILNEPDAKKRTALLKFFIKLADRCSSLNNFATSRSILAALDSSTIARLHQTWLGVPHKQKLLLEELRKLADHSRNYLEYRTRLRNTQPPAVPFLGLYLTDLTFSREGNPSHRVSPLNPEKKLINYDRFAKLARIVQDIKRFSIPYSLKPIPEVQEYLHACFEQSQGKSDLQDLYRRSLLVEPKRAADTGTTDVRQIFSWTSRTVSAAGSA